MKFYVQRASEHSDYDPPKPCDGAERVCWVATETMPWPGWAAKRGEQYSHPPLWKVQGRNHRVEGEDALREIDKCAWTRDFETLADVMALIEKMDSPVIIRAPSESRKFLDPPTLLPIVVIYDDYVE